MPTSIQAQLTWANGKPQAWQTFNTSGHHAGDVYLLDLQVANPVTSIGGGYQWQVEVKATLPNNDVIDRIDKGTAFPDVATANVFGAGWGLEDLDSLVPVANYGELWVYGDGDPPQLFRTGAGNTYVSPPNVFGTLVKNGDGSFTFTDKHQLKRNFDSTGKLSTIVDPHGLAVTYTYSGGNLSTIQDPDGGVTTFTYTGSQVTSIALSGGRMVYLSYTGSDLTGITNPDGGQYVMAYDGVHRMVLSQIMPLTATISYDTGKGVLASIDWGGGTVYTLSSANVAGMVYDPTSGKLLSDAVGVLTDPLGYQTTYTMDAPGRGLKLQTPDGAVWSWQLDQAGQVVKETDPRGNVTSWGYLYGPGQGDLVKQTDADGGVWTVVYDPTFHYPTQVQDPRGFSTFYTYSATTGDLLTVKDPLNHVTTLTWSAGLLQTVTDPLLHTTTYESNTAERLLTDIIDATGARASFTYDPAGNLATYQDPLGHVTSLSHDGMRRVTQEIAPDGGVVSVAYNAVGEVVRVTDQRQHVTLYDYDGHGWLTTLTQGADTASPLVTTFAYDVAGNAVSTTDPRAVQTTAAYDPLGRPLSVTEAAGTSLARSTGLAYDLNGNLVRVTDPRGYVASYAYNRMDQLTTLTEAVGTAVQRTSGWAYDLDGNVVQQTDPRGTVASLAYDALDRPTTLTQAVGQPEQRTLTMAYDAAGNLQSSTDPLGVRTSYGYDADNRVTTITEAVGTPVQRSILVGYDPASNVVSVTDARGYSTNYGYDPVNRLTTVTEAVGHSVQRSTGYAYDLAGNLVQVTDPLGGITSLAYDAFNRATTVTEAVGTALQRTRTQAYDGNGNPTVMVDALGYATTLQYDALNRVTTVIDAANETTTAAYDGNDNLLSVTDPLGHATNDTYDPLNRVVTITDARGGQTTLAYDGNDNVVRVVDPVGNRTSFAYDRLDRVTQRTDPFGHTATMAYDKNDNLTSTTDRLGRRQDLSYDSLNRLTTQVWVSAAGTPVNTLTYSHDPNDNLTGASDSHGTYTMAFDALNRLTSEQEPFGQALTMAYDAVDDRTSVQDSGGGVMTSTYDALHRLATVQFGGSGLPALRADLTYTPRDQLATLTRYSDLQGTTKVGLSAYGYDAVGRMTSLQQQDGQGATLENYGYGYDAASRLSTETLNGGTTSYGYDATNELTTVTTASGSTTYGYDLAGNRNMAGYQTGTNNQLLADGTFTYAYDAEGNMTQKRNTATGEQWSFGYDHFNHLTSAVDVSGTGTTLMQATYAYDVMGQRIEKDVAQSGTTTVTRFAYDGGQVWADLNGSNAVQTHYLRSDAVDMLFANVSSAGTASWYLTDRLGSVRNLTDASGHLQDTLTYDGFGQTAVETNPAAGSHYQYASGERDAETGMLHFGQRYYDAGIGRWTSQDRIGFAGQDPNLYRYVHNDPSNAVDPSGLVDGYAAMGELQRLDPEVADILDQTGWILAERAPHRWHFGLTAYPSEVTADGRRTPYFMLNSDWSPTEAARFISFQIRNGNTCSWLRPPPRPRELAVQAATADEAAAMNAATPEEKARLTREMLQRTGALGPATWIADRNDRDYQAMLQRTGALGPATPWLDAVGPGGWGEQILMGLGGFVKGVPETTEPFGVRVVPEPGMRARPETEGEGPSGSDPTPTPDCSPPTIRTPMDWQIPINEDGVIDAVGRAGDIEVEIIGNMSRSGNTITLDKVHFTKNAGGTLGPKQLQEFGRDFLRQHGNGATQLVIIPAPRTTGATAGSGIPPKAITIHLDP